MTSAAASPGRRAAYAYLSRGWSVIPLRHADKRPLLRWEPYQNRLPGEEELRRWFAAWPDANLGIVTGSVSRLVVLDIDPAHGGVESLAALERRHGPLPASVEARTGGGGRHVYFLHPGGMVRNRAGLAQGVDVRGDGGYVVAPPSIHPSGGAYAWVEGRGPDEIALAPLPGWLAELSLGGVGRPLAQWRALVRGGVEEGQRNSTIASLTGHLLWHGVDPTVALELMLAWNRVRCRPPLDEEEVAQTVRSIVRLHQQHAEESES